MGSGHVGKDRLEAANTQWEALFYRDLELSGPGIVGDVCKRIDMKNDVVNIDWLGQVPSMVQWLGPRQLESLQDQEYILRCLEYATGTTIKRKQADDDNLGQYDSLPSSFVAAAQAHRRQLLANLIINNAIGYDGVNLYAATHQDESETVQDNHNAGAGTTMTPANVIAALSQMGQVYGSKGRPLGITGTHVIYGPANMALAATVWGSEFISDGTTTVSNPTPSAIKPLMLPELGSSTLWAMVDLSKGAGMRPFLLGVREDPIYESTIGDQNDTLFMLGEYKVGVRARHTVRPGLWQLINVWDGTV